MSDPLEKAGAKAPPIIGGGCTQRYDPEHLGPELGTEFPDAEALWRRHQPDADATATMERSPSGITIEESDGEAVR
jgi:hypothetical protein